MPFKPIKRFTSVTNSNLYIPVPLRFPHLRFRTHSCGEANISALWGWRKGHFQTCGISVQDVRKERFSHQSANHDSFFHCLRCLGFQLTKKEQNWIRKKKIKNQISPSWHQKPLQAALHSISKYSTLPKTTYQVKLHH